jgi:DNA (cytosine-5)-methyltransferase 1
MALGIDVLGIELDDAACATREAAGLRTLHADVAKLDPTTVLADHFGGAVNLDGLIASPPCQAFSMAGKGAGRAAIGAYTEAIVKMQDGLEVDREALDSASGDPRGHLVLEPLRWALALRPRWIALEQVPPVLPLWEAMEAVLRSEGWATWTGVLSAERYGVPQTRQRAIMLARMGGEVGEPPASHARYVAPRRQDRQEASLFDAPEPERIVRAEDRELLPWVSMADALGWGMTARPGLSISHAGQDGGSGARASIERERESAWIDRLPAREGRRHE